MRDSLNPFKVLDAQEQSISSNHGDNSHKFQQVQVLHPPHVSATRHQMTRKSRVAWTPTVQ